MKASVDNISPATILSNLTDVNKKARNPYLYSTLIEKNVIFLRSVKVKKQNSKNCGN